MSISDVIKVVLGVLAAFGGAGVIVLKCSDWLAKIWADRILEKEKQRHSAELEEIKADFGQRLEAFKTELSVTSASRIGEDKALRDYRYEARKRLYEEIEPLLFQLAELSEESLHRIYSLARTARAGDLDKDHSWLDGEGYYMHSTMYKLIAPMAVIRLIQRRLTLVDLTVDPYIRAQYHLAKWLYRSLTDDFVLARGRPFNEDQQNAAPAFPTQNLGEADRLEYKSNDPAWREKRITNEASYWRQGLPIGVLDKAADLLIVTDADTKQSHVMTFGAFEDEMKKANSEVERHFRAAICDIFHDFHPDRRPVLWRILIVQFLLCLAIARIRDAKIEGEDNIKDFDSIISLSPKETQRLNWHSQNPAGSADAGEPIDNTIAIAKSYLLYNVQDGFNKCREAMTSATTMPRNATVEHK